MCSIYGIMYYKNHKNQLEEKMRKMSKATIYRGPDENEIKYFDNTAIGMNRLSIIGPKCPNTMVQNCKEIYSVFNGEITNFKDFRNDVNINADCDSKVIIPLYKKYGDNFVKKLGGMFAIAIEDGEKTVLIRDQFGTKPMYYYVTKDGRLQSMDLMYAFFLGLGILFLNFIIGNRLTILFEALFPAMPRTCTSPLTL